MAKIQTDIKSILQIIHAIFNIWEVHNHANSAIFVTLPAIIFSFITTFFLKREDLTTHTIEFPTKICMK